MSRPSVSKALLFLFVCIGLIDIVGGTIAREYGDMLWGIAVLLGCAGCRSYANRGATSDQALPTYYLLFVFAAAVALCAQVFKRLY
jgi:hypothetical protein